MYCFSNVCEMICMFNINAIFIIECFLVICMKISITVDYKWQFGFWQQKEEMSRSYLHLMGQINYFRTSDSWVYSAPILTLLLCCPECTAKCWSTSGKGTCRSMDHFHYCWFYSIGWKLDYRKLPVIIGQHSQQLPIIPAEYMAFF